AAPAPAAPAASTPPSPAQSALARPTAAARHGADDARSHAGTAAGGASPPAGWKCAMRETRGGRLPTKAWQRSVDMVTKNTTTKDEPAKHMQSQNGPSQNGRAKNRTAKNMPKNMPKNMAPQKKLQEAQLNTYRAGPDEQGFFGLFGGRFVAETLMPLIL